MGTAGVTLDGGVPDPGRSAHGLELDGTAFRSDLDVVAARLAAFLDGLGSAPASWPAAAADVTAGPVALPRTATPLGTLLDELFARLDAGINTAAPGFMGYIPGGGIPHAAIADLIGDIINRYVGIAPPAPRLAAIETEVLHWFAAVAGMPAGASGTFTSGGSAANLIAIAAAREDRFGSAGDGDGGAPRDTRQGTVYVSDQVHHSVLKAARIAGLHASRVRVIGSDAQFRMDPELLRQALEADRERGLEPFLLVGSAGTTNTGAVDPLPTLADVAAAEDLWFHVDAAYGGFFALTDRGRAALAGMERADSLVLDPHKTLFLPYGTGALLVRQPARVAGALALGADYLPQSEVGQPLNAADLSFELTRPFRGLRVWLPLRLHGAGVFAQLLDEKLDLAASLADTLRELPDIELLAEPQLSTLAFAARPRAGEDADSANARTVALLDHINASRRVLVTGTRVRGRFVIRPSIVSFRTHRADVEELVTRIRTG